MRSPTPRAIRLPDRNEYGDPGGETKPWELLPWSEVSRWLAETRYYWLAAVRESGRPHVVPIWAVWIDGALYFATSPRTAIARLLARSPHVTVHPESAQEVAILEGVAERPAPAALPPDLARTYEAKYGWKLDPADPEMAFYVVRPRAVSSWASRALRRTATRWTFD